MQHSKELPGIAKIKSSDRECHNLKTARENNNYNLIHTRSIINNMTAKRVTIKSTDRGCHIQNPGEGTCWSVVYRCVNKTTTRKGTCAALSSFRVGKNAVFVGKGFLSYEFYRRLQNKRVSVLIYYTGKGYVSTAHSEKGYQFQNVEHSV